MLLSPETGRLEHTTNTSGTPHVRDTLENVGRWVSLAPFVCSTCCESHALFPTQFLVCREIGPLCAVGGLALGSQRTPLMRLFSNFCLHESKLGSRPQAPLPGRSRNNVAAETSAVRMSHTHMQRTKKHIQHSIPGGRCALRSPLCRCARPAVLRYVLLALKGQREK